MGISVKYLAGSPVVGAVARGYGHLLGWVLSGAQRIVGRRTAPLGPGRLLGIVVAAHVLVFTVWAGPLALIAALAVGVAAAVLAGRRINWRILDDAELSALEPVFADRAAGLDDDWLRRVVITDLAGRGGRAFTVPGPDGYIYCHLGPTFGRLDSPAGRRLLVHELTHALQINRIGSYARFLGAAIALQLRHELGEDVYTPRFAADVTWESLNLEQQATAMEQRADRMSEG